MLTSKQRASLRGMANTLDTILYIGKEGITDNTVKGGLRRAGGARADQVRRAAGLRCSPPARRWRSSCARVHAEPVQCIGRRFVMYRERAE